MATFVDPFLLTITLIMVIVLLVANVYFVAHFAHYNDSSFGSSTACKAVIVSFYSKTLFEMNFNFIYHIANQFYRLWLL